MEVQSRRYVRLFFFSSRRRHTRLQGDWSSDVCSSDLVALVETARFWPGEEANDAAFAQTLAALGDFYVNDAFGSAHRAHASTEAVARLLRPAVTGFLMERELRYLGEALDHPKRPFVAVLGG